MNEKTLLESCPFCGGNGHWQTEHDADDIGYFLSIKCLRCRAQSGQTFVQHGGDCPATRAEVRQLWNQRAASPSSKSTKERSDKDYAIEHAGYMAEAAKNYLAVINAEHIALADWEDEQTEANEAAVDAATEACGEAYRVLSSRIYEFEKRRDRALASSSTKEDGERAEPGERERFDKRFSDVGLAREVNDYGSAWVGWRERAASEVNK